MANRPSPSLFRSIRRSSLACAVLALSAAGISTLAPCTAHAQGRSPIQAPPPNVLLLVDTSGSMERMPDGTMPTCSPGVASEPNRWGSILQSLTGSAQPFYSCGRILRDNSAVTSGDMNKNTFESAFWNTGILGALDLQAEYDVGYSLPHHRMLTGSTAGSDTCAIFPYQNQGLLSGLFTSRSFTPNGLRTYPWSPNPAGHYNFPNGHSAALDATTTSGQQCLYQQATDGQMDIAARFARFGLMTFDNDPNPGTGSVLDLSGLGALIGLPGLGAILPGLNLNVGGQWTYLYTNSDPISQVAGVSNTNKNAAFPLLGRLPGCAEDVPMAVGARNPYAPSWEGPFMRFPNANVSLEDLAAHNKNVQTAMLATRPYGGTPIAGIMASAYDYMARYGGTDAPRLDPYVQEGCREQFVVLLTDGGPNLDLRTQELCSQGQANQAEGTNTTLTNYCPFYRPARTAEVMRNALPGTAKPITTIVVGFSVGHDSGATPSVANDGFPPAVTTMTCSDWRNSVASDLAFTSACSTQKTLAGASWENTSARACCELHDIAMAGSNNGQGAYFAETQSDLVGVFAKILGTIAKSSSTRATPTYSNATTVAVGGVPVTQSGTFVSSFVADPSRSSADIATNQTGSVNIWTGQINRTRARCQGGAASDQPIDVSQGDSYEENLRQTTSRPRYFFTALPDRLGGRVDTNESIRPYASTTISDGVERIAGSETILARNAVATNTSFRTALMGASDADIGDAFDITANSCARTTVPGNTRLERITDKTHCARVMWGFATAATPADLPDPSTTPGIGTVSGAYAVRCPIGGGHGQGGASVCKPLGAIIHSSPTIVGAPSSLLRDDGYRKFADYFKDRHQTLYVETTDGLLRAFDATYTGSGVATTTSELWSFIPPAVMPELQTNFPGGQRAILDNSPVVKDVVYDRSPAKVGLDTAWHTSLVAGLPGGYFALDVSADGEITAPSNFAPANTTAGLDAALRPSSGAKPIGPHFLWQLTAAREVTPSDTKGKGKKGRGAKNKRGQKLYSLFGDRVGTPAITTLYIDDPSDGLKHEVGVAILPGGIDDDVPSTATAPSCTRRTSPLPTFSGADTAMAPRTSVRGWGANCNSSVAGRSVTVVRLDTGEVIRHFARNTAADADVPQRLIDASRVTNSPFDAPITGTPVVFPNDPGSIAQKAFVGDADGTLWRLDLSSSNPATWKAELFLDTRGTAFSPSEFTGDKPIAVAPVLSLGDDGQLVIDVANGDQEDLGRKVDASNNVITNDTHILWSVTEQLASTPVKPKLNWYHRTTGGERVTGPMAVFDKTLYYATYRPNIGSSHCALGEARIYGVDYARAQSNDPTQGGVFRIPNLPNPIQYTVEGPDLIPGVSVRASQGCAEDQSGYNDYFGGVRMGTMMTTPTSYSLVANKSSSAGPGGNAVNQVTRSLALPRTQTIVDSWASVVE